MHRVSCSLSQNHAHQLPFLFINTVSIFRRIHYLTVILTFILSVLTVHEAKTTRLYGAGASFPAAVYENWLYEYRWVLLP